MGVGMSRIEVIHDDMLAALPALAAEGVLFDSVVCDPPYHLSSIVKRFGGDNAAPAIAGATGAYARASSGFMGKQWDGGDVAFRAETWRAVWDVMKPGAHLIAFSGSRTYHRMACAIEDAGFEIRDQIMWLYGAGFPKSHNAGDGWGTALKPAHEPVVLARKPLIGTVAANVAAHGTGAINIDGCRVGTADTRGPAYRMTSKGIEGCGFGSGDMDYDRDGSTAGSACGRWPANVIHDGSDEVLAAFAAYGDKPGAVSNGRKQSKSVNCFGDFGSMEQAQGHGDSGTAARFFYSAKADASDRCGSKHPTVKPTDLMAYLCRLVTPKGGLVLDPFAGSGSTGMACLREGFDAVLIERETEYVADINRRIAHVQGLDSPLFGGAG